MNLMLLDHLELISLFVRAAKISSITW